MLSATANGSSAASGNLVGVSDHTPIGGRIALVCDPTGALSRSGTLGPPRLNEAGFTQLKTVINDNRAKDGLRTVEVNNKQFELYVEIRRPIRELIVVGAGHVAQPMAHIGALLGYKVTVLDDRPDFATRERFPDAKRLVRADFADPFAEVTLHERSFLLLVTRGHKYDYECLVRALRACPAPAYIGMIGSRRRVRATYVQLLEEGIDRELLDRIHAPVGLDIGAETPEEIAVSVAAELVMLDRGGSGSSLKDLERVASRFFSDTSLCKNPDDGEPPEENFKATET
ncbi:XdhC family protein [Gemmatimonadales bacterium]|nr:XdhC family protein [Gemmatimonadales bacterium]